MFKRGKPDIKIPMPKIYPPLNEGYSVRLKPFLLGKKEWMEGVVVERLDERPYEIETADGSTYRRYKIHLRRTNEPPPWAIVSEPPGTSIHKRSPGVANELFSEFTFTEPPQVSSYLTSLRSPDLMKSHLLGIRRVLNPAKSRRSQVLKS